MKKAKRLHEDPLGKRQDVRYGMFDRPIPPKGSEPSQIVPLSASSQTSTQLTTLKQPVEDPDFVPVGKKQMQLSVLELAKLMPDEISQKFYKRVHQLAIDLLDGNSLEKQIHATGEQLMNLESKNLSNLSKMIESAVKASKRKIQLKESVFKNPLESPVSLGRLLYDSLENDKVAGKALLKSDCLIIATALLANKPFRTSVKQKNDSSAIAKVMISVIKSLPEFEEDIKPSMKKQEDFEGWIEKVASEVSEYTRKKDYNPQEDWDDVGEKKKEELDVESSLKDWAPVFGFSGPPGIRQFTIKVQEKIKKITQIPDAELNEFILEIADEFVSVLEKADVLDKEEISDLRSNPDHVSELPSFRIFAVENYFGPAMRKIENSNLQKMETLFKKLGVPHGASVTMMHMLQGGVEYNFQKIKAKFDKLVQSGELTKENSDELLKALFERPTNYFNKLKEKFESIGDSFVDYAKKLYASKDKKKMIDSIVTSIDEPFSFAKSLNPNVGD